MAGIIRITAVNKLGDQDLLNSFAWVGDNAILADAELLADRYINIMDAAFDFAWSTGYTWGDVQINMWDAIVNNPLNPSIPYSSVAGAGDANGDLLPQGTALLLNFKAYGQPPNRKRLYVGGFTEGSSTSNGLPDSAIIAAGNTAISDLLDTATVNTHDYLPIVLRLGAEGQYLAHRVLDSGFVSVNWARLSSRRSR